MKIQGEMGGKEILRKIIFCVPFLFLQDIKHQFEKHFVTLDKKISAGENVSLLRKKTRNEQKEFKASLEVKLDTNQ